MASPKNLMPCLAAIALSLAMISNLSEATEFVVSWNVPSSPNQFNKWAEKERFEIGDSIVFKYDPKNDSLLQVTEENYKSCKSNPIKSYTDGNTKITLDNSGPYFFISGAKGHCEKGQKLEIKVLSAKHGHHSAAPAPSQAAKHHHAPAPAPPSDGGFGLKAGFVTIAGVGGILALI